MSEQAENITQSNEPMGTGRRAFQQIVGHSRRLQDRMRELNWDPDKTKTLKRRFTISQAASMVGKSPETIRRAEAAGELPQPVLSNAGRRVGYKLEDVNRMRDHFGANPWRADGEEPIRLAFQNLKGGVGKTTLCVHFAQYLAEHGYRVILIDADSQASATSAFGLAPERNIDDDTTLAPFLSEQKSDLSYAVRKTYWDRLDIIPANLTLYTAEYELAAAKIIAGDYWLERLLSGIRTIEHNYDVIILDPPPALGSISLSVLRALNALIVPVPPAMYDYDSSVTFFEMMDEILEGVERVIGGPLNFKIFRLLVSKFDTRTPAQKDMVTLMSDHYSRYLLNNAIITSAEFHNAAAEMSSVYELTGPTAGKETYDRCMAALNGTFREIETAMRNTWPSHTDRLQKEGIRVL